MKRIVAAPLLLLSACATTPDALNSDSPATAYSMEMDGNRIVSLTGSPRSTYGTKSEIIGRAQGCAARTLSYGDVTASGSTATLFGTRKDNISVGAGQLIEAYDPANGVLVANTRVSYSAALIPYSAQARITVEAKDGRFRVVLGNPAVIQRDTGYASTDAFRPIHRVFGTNWNAAVDALTNAADRLATCTEKPASDW